MLRKIFNFQFSRFAARRATFNSENGQTLLIVVLVMVVALIVGLAIVSRSIINLRTSTEEESSQRAFSAAEAGIEKAIKVGCITPAPTGAQCAPIASSFSENSSSYTSYVTPINGTQFLLNGGNPVDVGEGADVWLVEHDSNGNPNFAQKWNGYLTFYWGAAGGCNDGALEIIIISRAADSPLSTRYAYDVNDCAARSNANSFTIALDGGDVAGKTFLYGTPTAAPNWIQVSSGMLIRIIPLYHSTPIGVASVGNSPTALPTQGNKIESIGISKSTNRKITFYQGYPSLPSEFFPYILFSPK